MFRTILLKTLYDWRKGLLFWSVGVFAMVFMYAAIYPSFADSQELVDALQNMPDAFKSLVGDLSMLTTPEGFIGTEFFSLTYPLLVGILAINLGSGLLYKEEDSGTIELLLARPLSRQQIYNQKALSLITVITVVGLAGWLGIALGTLSFEFELSLVDALGAVLVGILLAVAFGLVTLCITAFKNNRGLAIGLSSVLFAGSYTLTTFTKNIDWIDNLRPFSLFEYYRAQEILLGNSDVRWWVLGVVAIGFYVLGLWLFQRRDIGV